MSHHSFVQQSCKSTADVTISVCVVFLFAAVTQEYLHVLGLSHDNQLDRTSIKAAFHKAAIQWHPDKHVSTADKADAEAKFKRAKEAYEGLTSLCA